MAVPRIFDRNMKRLAYLENAKSVGYLLETNSLWTASFELPATDTKNQYCKQFNYVEIFDGDERIDLFRIIEEDLSRSDGSRRVYNCEHVLATLLNDVMFQYHQYGGTGLYTSDAIKYVLSHQSTTRWVLKTCSFKRGFEYNWENSNLLAAIFAIPECFDSEYLWQWNTTVYPWELSLVSPSSDLRGEIRYEKNMTEIHKNVDSSNLANRVYALGYGEGVNQLTIKAVNNGVPYVEDADSIEKYGLCPTIIVDGRYEIAENLKTYSLRMLKELKEPYVSYRISAIDLHRLTKDKMSKYRPSEMIRVVDNEDGITVRTRIVSIEKSDVLGDPGAIEITIANKERDIAGSISNLQNRALINETYAQGATNQQIYNFADNADQDHPAVLKIFVSDNTVRINKMVLNIEFEAFRAYEKTLKSGGGQTTSSGGGSEVTSAAGGASTQTSTSGGGGSYTSESGGYTSKSTSSGGATQKNTWSEYAFPSFTTGSADGSNGSHSHSIPNSLHHHTFDLSSHSHDFEVPSHKHSVSIGSHSHNLGIPSHSHSVSIPSHSHTVKDHTHEINFGIYEGETASSATIYVDGIQLPPQSNYRDINIISYLSTDDSGKILRNTWHTIKVKPDKMSRIVGAVFAQTFCASRGGGDY